MSPPADLLYSAPGLILILGVAFLIGLGLGILVEQVNLRRRERALARGRRHLTEQARSLRQRHEERWS